MKMQVLTIVDVAGCMLASSCTSRERLDDSRRRVVRDRSAAAVLRGDGRRSVLEQWER